MKEISNFQNRTKRKVEVNKQNSTLTLPCDARDVFDDEIKYIQNNTIKYFAKWCVNQFPEYFFTITTSKSGDYHPRTCNTKYGLVKHTK